MSSNNCTILTEEQYKWLAVVRGLNGVVCFLLTAVVLFVVLRLHAKKNFLERLFLYLTVVTLFHTGLFVLQMVEEAAGEDSGFCKALGFFLEWVGWVLLSTTFLIIIYQLHLLTKTVRNPQVIAQPTANPKRWQYCTMLTGWTPLPLVFVWIPFSIGEPYSHAGAWCWISSIGEDCRGDKVRFIEMIILGYIPVLIIGVFALDLALLMATVYCCWACRYEHLKREIPRHVILMACFLAFGILCGMELIAQTHTAFYRTHNFAIWIAYAVSAPWRDFILILGYGIYLYPSRTVKGKAVAESQHESVPSSRDPLLDVSAYVNIETLTAAEKQELILQFHRE